MSDTWSLRFLYRTVPGRMILKLLVRPKLSEAAGKFLSSRLSAPLALYYIRKYGISMEGIEVPAGGFPSFNAFFTRKREDPCAHPGEDALISPCDGFLTSVKIRGNAVFPVKNTWFSLEELLLDRSLARRFEDGTALIFRLTPANYHRYVYAADGQVLAGRKIPGILHCVRPVALHTFPVFAQNSREYEVIRTRMGALVQMEVGALLVGKITNHGHEKAPDKPRCCPVRAGEEKGYFEFGGSTIILLLEKGAVRFCGPWTARSPENGEIPVKAGELLAKKLVPAGKIGYNEPDKAVGGGN